MALGTNLKEILKQKNMTIKDLSKKSGVSVNTLYSITKRDGRMARFDIIKKICEALEIEESELLGFDVQPEDYKEENSRSNLRVYEVHRNSDLRNGYIDSSPPTHKNLTQHLVKIIDSQVDQAVKENFTNNTRQIELLCSFDNLNDAGKTKVIDYAADLSGNPDYRKDSNSTTPIAAHNNESDQDDND